MERHQDGFTTRRALGLRNSATFVVREDVSDRACRNPGRYLVRRRKIDGGFAARASSLASSIPLLSGGFFIFSDPQSDFMNCSPLAAWSMCSNLRPVVRIVIKVQPLGCSGFFSRRLLHVMNTGPAIRRFTSQSLWRTSKACESG